MLNYDLLVSFVIGVRCCAVVHDHMFTQKYCAPSPWLSAKYIYRWMEHRENEVAAGIVGGGLVDI